MGMLDFLRGKKKDELGADPLLQGSNLGLDGVGNHFDQPPSFDQSHDSSLGQDPALGQLGQNEFQPQPFHTPSFSQQNPSFQNASFDNAQSGLSSSNLQPSGNPFTAMQNSGFQHAQSIQSMNNSQNSSQSSIDKDLQILSLKLDAIKSELDSLNQRVKNIELLAEKDKSARRWY